MDAATSSSSSVILSGEAAYEAISALGKASKQASDLLDKSSKLLDAAASLSKLAKGLGAIGAVTATLDFFIQLGRESDTAKILDAISDLGEQISSLEDSVKAGFARMELLLQQTAAITVVLPSLNAIDVAARRSESLIALLNRLAEPMSEPERAALELAIELAQDQLLQSTKLDAAVTTILNGVLGRIDGLSGSIPGQSYELTLGSLDEIDSLSSYLYDYATLAVVLWSQIQTIQSRRKQPDSDPELLMSAVALLAEERFTRDLDQFVEGRDATLGWRGWSDKCKDEDQIRANVLAKLATKDGTGILEGFQSRKQDEYGATDKANTNLALALTELSKQWSWFDWYGIIYEDGTPDHGYNSETAVTTVEVTDKGWHLVVSWQDAAGRLNESRLQRLDTALFPPRFVLPVTYQAHELPDKDTWTTELLDHHLKYPIRGRGVAWYARRDRKKRTFRHGSAEVGSAVTVERINTKRILFAYDTQVICLISGRE